MTIPSDRQYPDLINPEAKIRLLVAMLNMVRLEIKEKEPEISGRIVKSLSIIGVNVDDE